MKHHRDSIATVLALVLGVVLMTGMVVSDEYANAASAEARGYDAWFAGAKRPSGGLR